MDLDNMWSCTREESAIFDDKVIEPPKPLYKVYNDGGHYIASRCVVSYFGNKEGEKKREKDTEYDVYFNELYRDSLSFGLTRKPMRNFIVTNFIDRFPDEENAENYALDKIKVKLNNHHKRLTRLRRKVALNRWNYFVTFTYDSKLHSEETFKKTLRKCLSNLHCRRGWNYIGACERGEDSDRLHYHFLMYIPEGQLLDKLKEKKDYDTKYGGMRVTHESDFFLNRFGRNDFDEIRDTDKAYNYLLKYIRKQNGRLIYSRGVPAAIYMELRDEDIAAEMTDFGIKFVLCDDVMYYHRYVYNAKYEQISFFET